MKAVGFSFSRDLQDYGLRIASKLLQIQVSPLNSLPKQVVTYCTVKHLTLDIYGVFERSLKTSTFVKVGYARRFWSFFFWIFLKSTKRKTKKVLEGYHSTIDLLE
jgi:hypothetical protein